MTAKTVLLLLLALCCRVSLTFSQAVTYVQTKFSKYPYVHYLGRDQRYYYCKTGEQQITRFAIGRPADFKDIRLAETVKGNYYSVYLLNTGLYTVRQESETNDKTQLKKNTFHICRLNPENGSLLKKVSFERTDSSKRYFAHVLDTVVRRFFIKKSGDIISSYDFDLEETEDFTPGKVKSKPVMSGNFSELLADLMKALGSNVKISINGDLFGTDGKYAAQKDSLSMDYYNVSYERRKDEDVYAFKNVVIELEVESKLNKTKVPVLLDEDMHIIDINYREDADGRLLLFGKYMIKGKVKSRYGMFSVIFNKDMSLASRLKYNELITLDNFEGTAPNEKYVGFIFTKLHNMDYEFHLKEAGMFVFTYQHVFSNLQDHIYLMKLEKSGEISVSRIVNRLNQKTKSGYNEKHLALLSGNQIHFLFYDHADNVGMKVNELNYTTGDIEKKSCVLMSSTYNIQEDEFSRKTLLATKKTLVQLPHLDSPVLLKDDNTGKYICMLKGFDKKRNTVSLFEFYYTAE